MRILSALLCSAMLAGCAATLAPATPNAARSVRSYSGERGALAGQREFHTVYSFAGAGNGKWPTGHLIEANGVFYGTTRFAGDSSGVVFSFTPSAGERVLYRFTRDGDYPGALTYLNGVLYGTTQSGGTHHAGTVFSLSLSGAKRVIYSFAGGSDGDQPDAIVADGGKLYGTTETGGTHSYGTFFELTVSGKERVLHSFGDGSDGTAPYGALVVDGNMIYGTTGLGGGGPCYTEGCGSVYSMTTSGSEQIVYAFQGGADGDAPGHLLMMDGTLYGTTTYRGASGEGTVFALTTSGSESTVYTFNGGLGNDPSGLTGVNHKLYGTTGFGYAVAGGDLFEISTSGQTRRLHHFGGQRGGTEPWGDLIGDGNVLYGLTIHGGDKKFGSIYTYAL
jgi:uncharacterized repeat protein (TIGR03803 family)